jgi:L-fuculose-phosphate aldolase
MERRRQLHPDSISPGALKTEDEHRRDICTVGRWFHERFYVASTDGNISVRLGPQRILTSPTGISKGMMSPANLVVTDLDGKKVSGDGNPSTEMPMHTVIYRRRPDVNAICHAHPPTATAYAAAGLPLNRAMLAELVVSLGCIPVAPYGTPGTSELTQSIEPLLENHDAILLANHGVVTYGPDLLTAFFRMETTEHFARVALATELIGRQVLLSGDDVAKLLAIRARYAAQTSAAPGTPSLVTSGADPERITLTRSELDALIEEAIQKDRSRR